MSRYLNFTETSTGPLKSRPVYIARMVVPGCTGINLVMVPKESKSPFFKRFPSAFKESFVHRTTLSG